MSLEDILENVYIFCEIFQASTGIVVQTWKREDVENAFKWAAYCEQLFKQSCGKPYYGTLDTRIREIGQFPWAFNELITLESLGRARQLILSNLQSNGFKPNEISLYIRPFTTLDESSVNEDDVVFQQGEILLKQVISLLQLSAHKKSKCEKLVLDSLNSFCAAENGRVVLLVSLTTAAEANVLQSSCAVGVIEEAQIYILHWILQQDDLHIRQIFSTKRRELVVEVCQRYFCFYKTLLSFLSRQSRDSDRSTIGESDLISFAPLLCQLSEEGSKTKTATITFMKSMVKNDRCGIWLNLSRHLTYS